MDYIGAKEFLAFVLNNGKLIDTAVAMTLFKWRKEELIRETEELMRATGIDFDEDTRKKLETCDSIIKLKVSINEVVSGIIVKLFKENATTQFMSDLENSLEDYIKKYKETLYKQLAYIFADEKIDSFIKGAEHKNLIEAYNKVLSTFENTIEILTNSVLERSDIPLKIVDLDTKKPIYSMVLIDSVPLVFYNKPVANAEDDSKLYLAVIKKVDGELEPRLLKFQLSNIESTAYAIVEHPLNIEMEQDKLILQDIHGELFAMTTEAETEVEENTELEENIEVKENWDEDLIPIAIVDDKYILQKEAVLSTPHLQKIEGGYVYYEVVNPKPESKATGNTVSVILDENSSFLKSIVKDVKDSSLPPKISAPFSQKFIDNVKQGATVLFKKKTISKPVKVTIKKLDDPILQKVIKESKPIIKEKKVTFLEPTSEITLANDKQENPIIISRKSRRVSGKRVQELVDKFEAIADQQQKAAEKDKELVELQKRRSSSNLSSPDPDPDDKNKGLK